jgi:3-hydroxy-5-methyl-1-naphthoate 3-O-methyltransferase
MSAQTQKEPAVTPERILKMMWAFAPPLLIDAAVENRVFDVLDGTPLTAAQLSAATGASERGIVALADALVGFELLSKDKENRYRLTPDSAAFLVHGKPAFQGSIFQHVKSDLIPGWLQVSDAVKSGRPVAAVNQQSAGAAFFEQFVEALFPMSYAAATALAAHLKVAEAKEQMQVLDVAAGSGVWGIVLAQASPLVQVTAVDWERVLSTTKKMATKFQLEDRFRFVPGDVLETDFGSNYAVATLGHILHSEGVERSKALLRRVHAALRPGGTIAIAEFLVNAERTGPPQGLIFGVNMLVNTDQGGTYSFEEISDWLRAAGFTNMRLLDAPGPSPLILAQKR